MEVQNLKTHYSVYELASLKLKTLPSAPKNTGNKPNAKTGNPQNVKGVVGKI